MLRNHKLAIAPGACMLLRALHHDVAGLAPSLCLCLFQG